MAKAGTILAKGEKESRVTTVNGNKVLVHHVTKHDSGKLVVCDWTFDFDKMSEGEIKRLASRSLVIDARGTFKGVKESEIASHSTQQFEVKKLIEKQKRGKSPAEKVATLFKGMSPEEIAAALKDAGIKE